MSEIPILNAPVYEHGYVTGRYLTAVADGPDDDHLMDFTPAKGKVIFTPETVIRRHEGPSPALVVQRPVECPINSQGYLTSPDGWRGVSLIVGIYSVRFEVQGAQVPGPKRIQVKASHTEDAPLDLVLSMPEVVPPGSVVVVNETTAQRAEAAAARAEAVVTNLESEVRAVVLASPELKGKQGDKGDKGDPGAPGALANASSYILVGPGRPDRPATTNGVITGKEPVGAEYRSTDGAGDGLFDWRKRPTGWEIAGGVGGSVPIFPTLAEAQAWEAANTGKIALTIETPPDPGAWTPATPTFDVVKKTITIPSDAGATYTVDGVAKTGTVSVTAPATVTVRAVAKAGYTLVGTTEWVKTFEETLTAYDEAALSLKPQYYYRLDDSALPLRNRGVGGPLTLQQTAAAQLGKSPLGVGATAHAGARPWFVGAPTFASWTAYTLAAVVDIKANTNAPLIGWITTDGPVLSYNTQPSGTDGQPLNRVQFGATSSALATVSDRVINLTPGTPVHVAITSDGTTVRAYINGAEVKNAPAQPITGNHLNFGQTDPGRVAGIVVDGTKAFTAAQIKALSDAVAR